MSPPSRTLLRAALGLLLGAAAPPDARAGEPPAAAPQEAVDHDAIFRRGLERFEAGDHLAAIAIWERLLQTLGDKRGYRALYNLGLAYQAAGDVTRAVDRYELFLQRVAEQPGELPAGLAERRQDALDRLQALRAAYGALVVSAPATGEVVLVRVGASEPRPAGFTLYLAPGEHRVEVASGTPKARTLKIRVDAGSSVTLDTTPAQKPAPRPKPPPPPPPPAEFPTAWVIAGAGLTAASAALPIAAGVRTQNLRARADELGRRHRDYPEALERFRDARTLYYLSYGAPAVLGAATLTIALVGLVRAGAPAPARPAAALEVSPRPGGVDLGLRGAF